MKKRVTFWKDTDSIVLESHTVLGSIIEDTYTFGITFAAQWYNYHYFDNGILFQLFLFVLFVSLVPKLQRETRRVSKEEAIKLLYENEEKPKKTIDNE